MPRTKQRTAELRQRVVSVAVDVLATEGVAGFTTRGIAREAETSTPAVYELFGDKAGLVREVFFEGFRMLGRYLSSLTETDDPRADLVSVTEVYRRFMRENAELAEVMFSRPFADFDPGPDEQGAGDGVWTFIVERVRRAVEAGQLGGEPTDVAHVLVALVQGMAGAENARRLGSTSQSVDRRWRVAVESLLGGLSPSPTMQG
jgi:AcrR family transcriptional regulator